MHLNHFKYFSFLIFYLFSLGLVTASTHSDYDEKTQKAISNIKYTKSSYNPRNWYLDGSADIPDQDLLAFNTVRITAKQTSRREEGNRKITETFDEVSTGFLMWSLYTNPTKVIQEFYKKEEREPLLVTCLHCVKSFGSESDPLSEIMTDFVFDFHYVGRNKKSLSLVTFTLKNTDNLWTEGKDGDGDIASLILLQFCRQREAKRF